METLIKSVLFVVVLAGAAVGLAPLANATVNQNIDSYCVCHTTCGPLGCTTTCTGNCKSE